jgi:hypothetical protein
MEVPARPARLAAGVTGPGARWLRHAGCLILVTVSVMLAACGAAHAPAPGPRGKAAPARFAPGTALLPVSEVAVLSDDRTLVAEAVWGCGGPPRLVAAPLARTVVLVLAQPPPKGVICAADLVFGPVHTTLAAPLRGRTLVQRRSLAPIPTVYQSGLAAVSALPPGYRFAALVPGSTLPGFGPGDRLASTRTFTAAQGDRAPVLVCEARGTALPAGPSGWPVLAALNVHDDRAIYRAEASGGTVDARMIAWAAGQRVFAVVSRQDQAGQHVPSEAQLLAVARGVR